MSDDQLIERTLAGETEAFGVLVRRWENPIYGLSLRMLGRDEDARDVCQETFISAYRNLRKFRGDSKFSSWLYRIALNACNSRLRRSENGLSQPLEPATTDGATIEYSGSNRGRRRRKDAARSESRIWFVVRCIPCQQKCDR